MFGIDDALLGLGAFTLGYDLFTRIPDWLNTSNNNKINSNNFQLQKENLDYQKALQQQLFNREDTSIQRRKADLQAAGLNPNLAAGSGAGAGQVVSTSAPQRANNQAMNLGNIIDTVSQLASLQQVREQTDYINEQKSLLKLQKEEQKYKNLIAQNDWHKSDIDIDNLYMQNAYNKAKYSYDFGIDYPQTYMDNKHRSYDYLDNVPYIVREKMATLQAQQNTNLMLFQGQMYQQQYNLNSENHMHNLIENNKEFLELQLKAKDLESYEFYKNLKSNDQKIKYLNTLLMAGRLALNQNNFDYLYK